MWHKQFHKIFVAFAVGLSFLSGGASAQTPLAPPAASSGPLTRQIIIKFSGAPQREAAAQELSAAAGEPLEFARQMAGGAEVWRLTAAKSQGEVENIAARISRSSLVEYAEADAIMQADDRPLPNQPMAALLTPNDTYFGSQWHYKAPSSGDYGIDAVGAWDITTGSSAVNVAVIDTGALFNHPDMAGKWLPGYDMISDSYISRDGDGRDGDAADMGDWTTSGDCGDAGWQPTNSSWHGTHVAGTIGAASNNGMGVAGVSWQSKIVPVRVLGRCGGTISDIVDGMYWAAGLSVPGAPANSNPAKVLNMSLGGSGACGTTYQNAVNAIRSAGASLAVAAGNSNDDVSNHRPGNCSGVISIASTDRGGSRAYYSNYGSLITLAAPGGDVRSSQSNGILSTLNDGTTSPGNMGYAYYQGTSMATPHVAGIIALMMARNNSLTPDQVTNILKQTVTPFPGGSTCNTSICGVGIANARAAVQAVSGSFGTRKVFLPMLSKAGSVTPPGGGVITGLIEYLGGQASGVSVSLIKRVGTSDTEVLTAITDNAGRYTFNNVPALGSGESYFVQFINEADGSYLYYWRTRALGAFGAGNTVDFGAFDIANVDLASPYDNATSTLPETFYWYSRGISGDSYIVRLYGTNGSPFAATVPLGDVSSFEMTSLPTGFGYDTPYTWEVGITSPDGGYGISFEYYQITFVH